MGAVFAVEGVRGFGASPDVGQGFIWLAVREIGYMSNGDGKRSSGGGWV